MPSSITDIVKAEFADLDLEAETALDEFAAVAEHLAVLDEGAFALAMAGFVKVIAEKKAGATVAEIAKKLIPVLLALIP